MGIDVDAYNAMALKAAQTIEKEAKSWTSTIILIMIVSMVLLFFILYLLSRGISRSIASEVPAGSQGPGHFYRDEDEDDKLGLILSFRFFKAGSISSRLFLIRCL